MKCSYCGKDISNLNKFVMHLEYAHKDINRSNFLCPFDYCSRSFHRRDTFKKHLSLKHSDADSSNFSNITTSLDKSENTSYLNLLALGPSCSSQVSENQSTTNNNNNHCKFNTDKKVEDFNSLLHKSTVDFVSKLQSNVSISRKLVQTVIDNVKDFLNAGFLAILKEFLILPNNDFDCHLKVVHSLLEKTQNCFNLFDTDYKRIKYVEASKAYITPVPYVIGTSFDSSRQGCSNTLVLKNRTTIFIPPSKILKLFFQIPHVLNEIIDYHNQTYIKKSFFTDSKQNESILKNIVDGSLWKETISKNKKNIVIPLLLYFDDFETSNPLGSHAGVYKLGVVYFSIPTLPPEYLSKLENIFLALIFHSSERSKYGNEKIFRCLIEELKTLEKDGITLETNNGNITILFHVILIVGDNLGIHSVLGLVESFSAHYFCRFCLTTKSVSQTQTQLFDSDIRYENLYTTHVEDKSFGVKETCIWNELGSFNVYKSQCADIMHDLYEGIHRYDIPLILEGLIKQNYFSLETLNSKIKYLNYEFCERNIPPPVTKEHLKNKMIIMSASEMLCFVENFRYAVGDLVPEKDPVWKFYLTSLKITTIVSAYEISLENISLLEVLIQNYLEMRISLFPGSTLKPKHHFLLHYPDIIKKVGPLSKVSCMRFEAKHRDLKKISNTVQCRKNLPLTIATKSQLAFATRCLSSTGLIDNIEVGKTIFEHVDYNQYTYTTEVSVNFNDFFEITWFQKNGIRYRKLDTIFYDVSNSELPVICSLVHILVAQCDIKQCYLICETLELNKVSKHYQAFEVTKTKKYISIFLKDLKYIFPTIAHDSGGSRLVSIPILGNSWKILESL